MQQTPRKSKNLAVELENQLVGPTRRSVRRAGIGLGKIFSFFVLIMGLAFLAGGIPLVTLSSGIAAGIGAVLLSLGLIISAIGVGTVWSLFRYQVSSEEKEIESQIFRMLAAEGRVTAEELSRGLQVELHMVEKVARRLAAEGKIERDVEEDRPVEVYQPLGWQGRGRIEALNDPKRHGERRDMEDFERKLRAAGAESEREQEAAEEEGAR
ncbi:MAG: hypothetical protein RBU37_05430 [Myxococcota bacterium]|jgi:DNA-binding HxlR family transcriptional regulator|nr:hypothetical protein [Myxococcota bacterium]